MPQGPHLFRTRNILSTAFVPRLMFSCITLLVGSCGSQNIQSTAPKSNTFSDARLAFRYTPPAGMHDKTERFRSQSTETNASNEKKQSFSALLAMSSGWNSNAPDWGSITIETYPRKAISEPDDSKAEAEMNAWVAHSKDTRALPKSAVISGQK